MKRALVFSVFLVVVFFGGTVFGGEEHITGYWGDPEWKNRGLAEDGDWNTAASVSTPNKLLFANHPYNLSGKRDWKCKYSSSGSQHTYGECHDYDAGNWAMVWRETSFVSGKTVTAPIPSGCLQAGQSIQLRVTSASSAAYYEGYILSSEDTRKRGMYVDYLGEVLDSQSMQDELLSYARSWGITCLALYGASAYVSSTVPPVCTNPKDVESCSENKLCQFIVKAKKEYGIEEVGTAEGICEASPTTCNPANFERIKDYNEKRDGEEGDAETFGKFDFLVTESEFWNNDEKYAIFLDALDKLSAYSFDKAVYLARPTSSQIGDIAKKDVDRVLLTCYAPDPISAYNGLIPYIEQFNNENPNIEIWPLLSAEYHNVNERFMGCWFMKQATIKSGMEIAELEIRNKCQSGVNCEQEWISGFMYFLYRCLKHPTCGTFVDPQRECRHANPGLCYGTINAAIVHLKNLARTLHDTDNIIWAREGIYEEDIDWSTDSIVIDCGWNVTFTEKVGQCVIKKEMTIKPPSLGRITITPEFSISP